MSAGDEKPPRLDFDEAEARALEEKYDAEIRFRALTPAAGWIVGRGIETLVLDLPSADRADDGGRLTAHRALFGLPPGSRDARAASRPGASITELAWIPAAIADGYYLLDLQIPPFVTDAAPSRPLLFPVRPA